MPRAPFKSGFSSRSRPSRLLPDVQMLLRAVQPVAALVHPLGRRRRAAHLDAQVGRKLAEAGFPNTKVSVSETTLAGKPGR